MTKLSKAKPDNVKASKLRISFTNVRGLRGNFSSVEAYLESNKPDVLALSETNLQEDILDADFSVKGYLPIRRKDSTHMLGLGVYIREGLPMARDQSLEIENQPFMCFRLALLHSTTYMYFLYRSPSSSSCSVVEAVSSSIDKALIRQPSAKIICCGDFNIHHIEWLTHSRDIDAAGRLCYNFALTQNLTQMVDFPTHIPDRPDCASHLLDLFLCSNPESCSISAQPPLGRSDHMVVMASMDYSIKGAKEHPFHRMAFSYASADWDGFRDYLRDVPWKSVFRCNANKASKEFSEWVQVGIDCFIPHRKFQMKPHSLPWFSPACAYAIAHRNHYFHQYHRSGSDENKALFNGARNRCKKVLERAKAEYAEATQQSIASQQIGTRDFWRITNSILNRGKSTIPPLFNGPEVLTSSKDKANLFANRFASNSTLDDSQHTLPDFSSRTDQEISTMRITVRMVARIISQLDASKAIGPDNIPAIVLKKCSAELSPVLSKLYNKCLAESCFPTHWKFSTVVPAYKNSGERSDPGNYRPISLLPITSKVFETLINNRLVKHLEGTGLFSDLQYGFRAYRSTADLLTVITERVYGSMDVGGETRTVALDISKAFDRVWHAGLLHKLRAYGVGGCIFSIISSFLRERTMKVVLDGQTSTVYPLSAGVPQVSVLGPTLFLIFINDLPDEVLSSICIYADDTSAYSSIKTQDAFDRAEMAGSLELDLMGFVEWGEKWCVAFNATKTKLLSFNRHRCYDPCSISMNGKQLEESDSLRLLGITFTPKLDWKPYVQSIAKQASQRVGSLFRSQRYLTKDALLYLYKASIRPCMEYCSHLWSGSPKAGCLDLLDRVQKRMLNLIGVDLAHRLDPLSHRRDVASLSLFYKYYHGHCSQEL